MQIVYGIKHNAQNFHHTMCHHYIRTAYNTNPTAGTEFMQNVLSTFIFMFMVQFGLVMCWS